MIASTRIRLSRNFVNFPLGPHINAQERLIIRDKVRSVCETFTGDLAGTFYDLEDMPDWMKTEHRSKGWLYKDDDPRQRNSGLERDWPKGRGYFYNHAQTFFLWVNNEDQLCIISMDS